jgi:hypothetical protein
LKIVSSVDHTEGRYRFVPGIDPYSGGVRALDGHRIVHATFRTPVPWRQGFERIDQVLAEWSRPSAALCSIELRCPRPHTFDDFASFNQDYRAALSAVCC